MAEPLLGSEAVIVKLRRAIRRMTAARLQQLDVLRALAILLVLCHHSEAAETSILGHLLKPFHEIGWMGVDLFFVLSGFLVSGLVIKEYQKFKTFDAWRFFVRRGFKIYPAYYAFLLISLPTMAWIPGQVNLGSFLAEAFFVQNSQPSIWGHTWSLAIEEQFYILLSLGFFLLSRRASDPLKWLFRVCVGAMIVCLLARCVLYFKLDPAELHTFYMKPLMTATLVRLDGLAFGVLLSYIYHNHLEKLAIFVREKEKWLLLFGCLFVAPCAIFGYQTFWLYVFGLTMLYTGFGALLLVALFCMPEQKNGLLVFLAGIGYYSYSIYLWHKPLTAIFPLPWFRFIPADFKLVIFLLASVGLCVAMAKLVEVPALKLRDKLYPSRSGSSV